MSMNQVAAVAGKTLKESLRDRMVLFWTYAVPLFFLSVLPMMATGAPPSVISSLKAGLTLTMISFLMMTAGQSNIPGSVAADKERGLYLKMTSMPVSPWREGLGRVIATWTFSLIGAAIVLTSGLIYGAEFNTGYLRVMEAAGFSFLVALSSVGVGFIIATLVRGESAATHTGVAMTLLTYFLGGMALPYEQLPEALKAFARLYPISSANASMIQLLVGESYVGYNPLTTLQTSYTVALSLLIFLVGLASYSRYCWRERD
jgi:ABC-type multidrug transport system permease subunit